MKDARGFAYALEPLRRKREWELDAARLALGRAASAVDLAQRRLRALEVRFAAARSHAARRAQEPAAFSLHAQQAVAGYFGALLCAIESGTEDLRRLEAEREKAMRGVLEASAAFEAVERDRAGARVEHESEVRRRELAVADESWAQRAGKDAFDE